MNSPWAEPAARARNPHRRDQPFACNRDSFVNTLDLDTALAAMRTVDTQDARIEGNQSVRHDDLQRALALPPYWKDAHGSVYILPDAPWGHRASRCLNALLSRMQPERANAVLCPKDSGHYEARIQASTQANAHAQPRRWMIDPLPATELDNFIQAFSACRWGALRSPVFRAWQ